MVIVGGYYVVIIRYFTCEIQLYFMCTNNVTYSNILPNMEIKEKIDFLRRKGWTLSAISDELGVGRETAYGWIARGHSPSNVKLVNLALDGLLQRNRIPKKKRYLNQKLTIK